MRRITMAIMTTIAALVLLFSYRTSTSGPGTTTPSAVAGAAPEGVVGGGDAPSAAPSPSSTSAAPPATTAKSVTVNGTAVETRWGPVQVQVKITSGRITDVVVLVSPTGERRDIEINNRALPILREQVIEAQGTRIDGVSGATVTTEGYLESLQAALDAAHFAA